MFEGQSNFMIMPTCHKTDPCSHIHVFPPALRKNKYRVVSEKAVLEKLRQAYLILPCPWLRVYKLILPEIYYYYYIHSF